jgi:hypothetical protein
VTRFSGVVLVLALFPQVAGAAPLQVSAGSTDHLTKPRLTGKVRARIEGPAGEPAPREISLRLSLSPQAKDRRALPTESSVSCPVRESGFTCEVPAGVFDLRIKGEGLIPVYRWGVVVEAGKDRNLGNLSFQRGSSVAGWVVLKSGDLFGQKIRVELSRESSGLPATREEYDRLRSLSLKTEANERGFFQFSGVPPGTYVVAAAGDGFASARRGSIVVRESLQSEILEPLELGKPLELEVRLEPPLDPFGKPWQLRLLQSEVAGVLNDGVWEGTASPEGLWRRPGLAPGGYRLLVLGDADERWAAHELQLDSGQTSVEIKIPLVPVRGTVTLGKEPLVATLWFGGRRGGRRIRIDSDEKGRYAGLLPQEGTWPLEIAAAEQHLRLALDPVEVTVPSGKTTATVNVRVPDTRLAGEVVDSANHRVPGALVSVFRSGASQVETDEKGEFELRGVKPGIAGIEAEDDTRTSGAVEVRIEEEQENPRLHLILQETLKVNGRVVSSLGPVPGAELTAFPSLDQVGFATAVSAVTGPDGQFTLALHSGTARIDLLVLAPGFALRMLPIGLQPARPLEISVEQDGGTLVLEVPEDHSAFPLLAHAGTFTVPALLQRWAVLQGSRRTPGRLVLPNVEPGAYSLCIRASADLRQGKEPPADGRCESGILPPLGELRLRLPASP